MRRSPSPADRPQRQWPTTRAHALSGARQSSHAATGCPRYRRPAHPEAPAAPGLCPHNVASSQRRRSAQGYLRCLQWTPASRSSTHHQSTPSTAESVAVLLSRPSAAPHQAAARIAACPTSGRDTATWRPRHTRPHRTGARAIRPGLRPKRPAPPPRSATRADPWRAQSAGARPHREYSTAPRRLRSSPGAHHSSSRRRARCAWREHHPAAASPAPWREPTQRQRGFFPHRAHRGSAKRATLFLSRPGREEADHRAPIAATRPRLPQAHSH